MVSTFTPNIGLEEPARGDYVGTWDTPVNNNMTLIDLVVGGQVTIPLNNSPVVLAAAQYECKTITFNSTLTGNVTITFPTSFTKSYEIYNACTGSSAFIITLTTTAAGGGFVCPPPGMYCDVINIGNTIRFKNLGGPVGSYWDYAGSSVPAWVSGSNPVPYFPCDGTTFASSNYPQLAVILGSTTLPDRRGTTGYTLNQGTGRLTTALGGLDGDTRGSLKTTQVTLSTSNLPAYTPAGANTGGAASLQYTVNNAGAGANTVMNAIMPTGGTIGPVATLFTQPTFTGTAQGGVSNVLPVGSATVYGICMIRAG